jgi:hypothetical protein
MKGSVSFKVINGAELTGKVLDQDSAFFFDSKRKSEQDYKRLLEDSQNFFHAYADGTLAIDPRYYYIYGNSDTEKYLDAREHFTGNKGVIEHISDDVFQADFYIKNPVDVVKTDDGFAFNGEDGRHRFFVAKKYNLDLLVRVEE